MSALFISAIILNYTIKKEEIKNNKEKLMHGGSFDVAHGLQRFINES